MLNIFFDVPKFDYLIFYDIETRTFTFNSRATIDLWHIRYNERLRGKEKEKNYREKDGHKDVQILDLFHRLVATD